MRSKDQILLENLYKNKILLESKNLSYIELNQELEGSGPFNAEILRPANEMPLDVIEKYKKSGDWSETDQLDNLYVYVLFTVDFESDESISAGLQNGGVVYHTDRWTYPILKEWKFEDQENFDTFQTSNTEEQFKVYSIIEKQLIEDIDNDRNLKEYINDYRKEDY
jgi:hypothetical protein